MSREICDVETVQFLDTDGRGGADTLNLLVEMDAKPGPSLDTLERTLYFQAFLEEAIELSPASHAGKNAKRLRGLL